MASVTSPLQDPSGNAYERAGRYLAQVLLIEYVLDEIIFVSLSRGVRARDHERFLSRLLNRRLDLRRKIDIVEDVITGGDVSEEEFGALPSRLRKVAKHRNRLAHRTFHETPDGYRFTDRYGGDHEHLSASQLRQRELEAIDVHTACCDLHTQQLQSLPQG